VIKEDAMKFKASCILFAIYLLSVIFLFNGPVYASMGSETSRNVERSKNHSRQAGMMRQTLPSLIMLMLKQKE
jgi:hypothetical protein